MNPTAEEKIWLVMEAIANAHDITSSGNQLIIDPLTFNKKITKIELERILDKLEKDHAIINVVGRPSDFGLSMDGTEKCFSIIIPDYPAFRRHLNFAHSRHFGGIDRLEGNNFFSICDVAMDILAELQMASANEEYVSIKTVPDIVRFPALLPAKSVNLLDRYGDYRMKALDYMKERGHIKGYEIDRDEYGNRWSQDIYVQVDRFDFEKFYNQLGGVYQRRVADPAKKAENKKKPEDKKENISGIPQTQRLQVDIVSMPPVHTKSLDENVITKSNKRVTLPKFPRTEWSKVSVKFTDERNVLLSNGKDTKPSSFEGLGCDDGRNGKPDENWGFLLQIVIGNGQTPSINKTEREKQKKRKQKIADILCRVFQNDTDPFETEKGGVYKAKFEAVYLNKPSSEAVDKRYGDLDEIRSEMTTSPEENTESEFSQ